MASIEDTYPAVETDTNYDVGSQANPEPDPGSTTVQAGLGHRSQEVLPGKGYHSVQVYNDGGYWRVRGLIGVPARKKIILRIE
jgi:hypothetical protein